MVRRTDSDFESQGTRCAGWLYEPADTDSESPAIVMAHGFGGERTARLPAFAERFAEAGYAVLLFDYRGFGDSDGEPGHVIGGSAHVEDYLAALEHARACDAVAGDRVALWGTSFSGGHAVETAARDGEVAAVVSQVPFTDGLRNALHLVRQGGLDYLTASIKAVARDLGRMATLRDPYYVPVVADAGGFGVLNTPDAKTGYESLIPDGESWDNECAARILATVGFYRPVTAAPDVDCPTFVVEATEDSIIPSGSVDALVDGLDDVERVRYDIGHFEAYTGEAFERVVARERAFFDRTVRD
ncbi:alpha/beta hydrolase [Halorientalis sp.]|jgi:pimeloyl-ACP methyl ester carboxylesterase|uniref:alpha/beta hydrolase n=1 Tax=Halorientalis sp. TaxID=1931229 RepID=UPI00263270D2|nr:alpha/beta fold hydrolase [Halorientalis sp.]